MESLQSLLQQWTSLPNLHPALVHFPIALAPAAWLFDVAALTLRSQRKWLARAATALWIAAAAGAGAAYWAGRRAADSLTGLAPQVQAHIAAHSDWGLYALWVLGVLAALRLLGAWLVHKGESRALLGVFVVVGLGGVAAVAYTADLGGGLVFQHAVAVAGPAPAPEEAQGAPAAGPEDGSSPEQRLHRSPEGVLSWQPVASDREALGSILRPAEGASAAAVQAAGEPGDTSRGLLLAVDGRTILRLPGTFGDVEVAAVLEPEDFQGSLGLAHHVARVDDAGLFTIRLPEGELALKTLATGREEKVLAQAAVEPPEGALELAVTAAGRHLRGTLGGELMVHGHEPPAAEGAAGLLFDGQGRVRVVSVTVTPIQH